MRRIPDGETGTRHYFVRWQRSIFPSEMLSPSGIFGEADHYSGSQQEVEHVVGSLPPFKTAYDDNALESYKIFRSMREQGLIPPATRFQVSLPTPFAVITMLHEAYQPRVEPLYEAALLSALRNIQDQIPAPDLAIQWDMALEFVLIEKIKKLPWFGPVMPGILSRIARLSSAVDQGVELGFHLCYGNVENKHFIEPTDTRNMVDLVNAIMDSIEHPISWIHMPVPKDREDAAYFAPLGDLEGRMDQIELYLGLVHAGDEEGTRRRIAAASRFVSRFGVATECGLGRTPAADVPAIFEVLAAVSRPWIEG